MRAWIPFLLILVACGKPTPTDVATPGPDAAPTPNLAVPAPHPEKGSGEHGARFPGASLEGLPPENEQALTVVYTNNLDGEIEPCG